MGRTVDALENDETGVTLRLRPARAARRETLRADLAVGRHPGVGSKAAARVSRARAGRFRTGNTRAIVAWRATIRARGPQPAALLRRRDRAVARPARALWCTTRSPEGREIKHRRGAAPGAARRGLGDARGRRRARAAAFGQSGEAGRWRRCWGRRNNGCSGRSTTGPRRAWPARGRVALLGDVRASGPALSSRRARRWRSRTPPCPRAQGSRTPKRLAEAAGANWRALPAEEGRSRATRASGLPRAARVAEDGARQRAESNHAGGVVALRSRSDDEPPGPERASRNAMPGFTDGAIERGKLLASRSQTDAGGSDHGSLLTSAISTRSPTAP